MTDLLITIALCVGVAVAYATAALIQARHGHVAVRALLRVPVWWLALALNGLGAALHVLSLNFGPLSLIQPLGVLTLVLAVPLAAMAARRRVTRLETSGMAGTVVGLAGLSLLITTSGDADTLTTGELLGLLTATTAVVGALGARGMRAGASPLWEAVAGGIAFAVCSALCQTLVVTATGAGIGALLEPAMIAAVVAVAAFAIAATVFTQRSYRNGLAAPLAVTNLVNPATAAAIGVVFLGEHLATTRLEVVLAVVFAALSAFGVTQLARARDVVPGPAPTSDRAPSPRDDSFSGT